MPITTGEARAIVRAWLTDNGFPACTLRAKTVSFFDLARESRIVATIYGWTPNPALNDLERIARAHKFIVQTEPWFPVSDLTPRIYVACLAAYNNGQLHGAWIDADQSADAIHDEIRAMLASSPIPGAEEWAIHDYEDFGGITPSEYEPIDRVAEIAALLVEYGEPFGAWYSYDPSADVSDFQDAYCGEYDSEEVYAEEFIADVGMLDSLPENLRYYFDYARFARDLFMSDMHSVRSGHGTVYVFRRN